MSNRSSVQGVTFVDEPKHRLIRINSDITDEVVYEVIDHLVEAKEVYQYPKAVIEISSPGGAIPSLDYFLERMKLIRSDGSFLIETQALTSCASAAAVILSMGDRSYASPTGKLQYHYSRASMEGNRGITAQYAKSLRKQLDEIDHNMIDRIWEWRGPRIAQKVKEKFKGCVPLPMKEEKGGWREIRWENEPILNELYKRLLEPLVTDEIMTRKDVNRVLKGDEVEIIGKEKIWYTSLWKSLFRLDMEIEPKWAEMFGLIDEVGFHFNSNLHPRDGGNTTQTGALHVSHFEIPEWKNLGADRLPEDEPLRHYFFVGETGSGKSASGILPLTRALLRGSSSQIVSNSLRKDMPMSNSSSRPNLLIIDPKQEIVHELLASESEKPRKVDLNKNFSIKDDEDNRVIINIGAREANRSSGPRGDLLEEADRILLRLAQLEPGSRIGSYFGKGEHGGNKDWDRRGVQHIKYAVGFVLWLINYPNFALSALGSGANALDFEEVDGEEVHQFDVILDRLLRRRLIDENRLKQYLDDVFMRKTGLQSCCRKRQNIQLELEKLEHKLHELEYDLGYDILVREFGWHPDTAPLNEKDYDALEDWKDLSPDPEIHNKEWEEKYKSLRINERKYKSLETKLKKSEDEIREKIEEGIANDNLSLRTLLNDCRDEWIDWNDKTEWTKDDYLMPKLWDYGDNLIDNEYLQVDVMAALVGGDFSDAQVALILQARHLPLTNEKWQDNSAIYIPSDFSGLVNTDRGISLGDSKVASFKSKFWKKISSESEIQHSFGLNPSAIVEDSRKLAGKIYELSSSKKDFEVKIGQEKSKQKSKSNKRKNQSISRKGLEEIVQRILRELWRDIATTNNPKNIIRLSQPENFESLVEEIALEAKEQKMTKNILYHAWRLLISAEFSGNDDESSGNRKQFREVVNLLGNVLRDSLPCREDVMRMQLYFERKGKMKLGGMTGGGDILEHELDIANEMLDFSISPRFSKLIFFGDEKYDKRRKKDIRDYFKKPSSRTHERAQLLYYSPQLAGPLAKMDQAVTRALKASFFEEILTPEKRNLAQNDFRWVYVADEFQTYITGSKEHGEQFFVDRCRAYGVCCIFATQSRRSLEYALKEQGEDGDGARAATDILLANMGTKIFFRSTDPTTIDSFSHLIAVELRNHNLLPRLEQGECWIFRSDGSARKGKVELSFGGDAQKN